MGEKTAGKPNWVNRTVWTGDNLDILRGMNAESVDLIYLDPPFNSNRNYEAPIGSQAAGAAFKDAWTLSDVDEAWHGEIADREPGLYAILDAAGIAHGKNMKSYLIMMGVRLIEMRRVLKSTGSLYLHCDPTASHYLKVLMDAVFGRNKYLGCITWRRTYTHNDKMFGATSDQLLWFGNEKCATRNIRNVVVPFTPDELAKKYPHRDGRGQHLRDNLMGPGTTSGESGQAWKGCDPTKYGRHWSAPKTGRYAKYLDEVLPGYLQLDGVHARLNALDDAGFIYWTNSGVPLLKRYVMPGQGTVPGDVWVDIPPLSRTTKERTGYPTQKPLALLDRIIRASSNPGDMVLDPFCGCATTCIAAEKAERQWAGIDLSPLAADLVIQRAEKEIGPLFKLTHRKDVPRRTDQGELPNYRTHRHTLFGRQEGVCGGCRHAFPFRNFTVDHVVPQSRGGTDHLDNLQLLCGACNSVKGNRDQAYLLAALRRQGRAGGGGSTA